jgi:hypothetical protein
MVTYNPQHNLDSFLAPGIYLYGSSHYDPRADRSINRSASAFFDLIEPIDEDEWLSRNLDLFGRGRTTGGTTRGGMPLYSSADFDTLFRGRELGPTIMQICPSSQGERAVRTASSSASAGCMFPYCGGFAAMDEEDFPFSLYSASEIETLVWGGRTSGGMPAIDDRRRRYGFAIMPAAVAAGPAPVPTAGSPVSLSAGALSRVRGGMVTASSGDEAGTLKGSYRGCMYPMCGGMYAPRPVIEDLNVKYTLFRSVGGLKTGTEVVDYQEGGVTSILYNGHAGLGANFSRGWPVKWEGPDFDALYFNPKEITIDKLSPAPSIDRPYVSGGRWD